MLRAASYLNVLRYPPTQRARRWLKVALAAQAALLASLVWLGTTLEASPFHIHHHHSHASLHDGRSHGPSAHEGDEGFLLASTVDEKTVYTGARCHPAAPVRSYEVVAVSVEITLNRYLDYDPQGRMYVLEEDLERVRQEEAQQLHAEDFQLINPFGAVLSKEQYLGGVASGEINYLVWEPETIEVRMYGEGAVIRHRSQLEIVVGGQPMPLLHLWHTDSYEKRDGRWQVVWSQATEIR
jgi:hypothetical protein